VRREGGIAPVAKAEGQLVQRPTRPTGLDLLPSQQTSRGSARYSVKVKSRRARPLQVLLSAADDNDALSFSFDRPLLQLSPEGEVIAKLTAQPKDKLAPGEKRVVHRFTVRAQVEGAVAPITVPGTLAQVRPFITGSRIGWIVRWVVVLAVILFLAMFLLAGIEAATDRSRPISDAVGKVMSLDLVRQLLSRLPFGGLARNIVHGILPITDALMQEFRGSPPVTPGPP
jgi:hypothetical protein